MISRSIFVGIIVAALAILTGCDRSDGHAYLPPELNEQSSLSLGEEKALRFAHQASTEDMAVGHSKLGLPTVHIPHAFVRLKPDHVLLTLHMDSTYTFDVEKWQAKAPPEVKDRIYKSMCTQMVAHLAQELGVSENLIHVEWTHMNATDFGTWINGELEANYHKSEQGGAGQPATRSESK